MSNHNNDPFLNGGAAFGNFADPLRMAEELRAAGLTPAAVDGLGHTAAIDTPPLGSSEVAWDDHFRTLENAELARRTGQADTAYVTGNHDTTATVQHILTMAEMLGSAYVDTNPASLGGVPSQPGSPENEPEELPDIVVPFPRPPAE